MEDIRPKGAWYAVYLDRLDDDCKIRSRQKAPVVSVTHLAELLPHGSGIDGNWTIKLRLNGDITCYGEYHAMHESGMYDGWRNFRFSLRRCKRNRYVKLAGPLEGKYQLTHKKGQVYFEGWVGGGDAADYLYECCYFPIADTLGIRSMETGHNVVDSPE